MAYSYADIPDKSVEGIMKEVETGLGIASFYWSTTYGFPLDLFKEELNSKAPTNPDKLLFYLNFRNKHPELFF